MKKSKSSDANGDGNVKKAPGRPKVLPPELDKRHQLRCATRDFDAWLDYSRRLGFPNVSAWIRKVVNDALPAELRRKRRPARRPAEASEVAQ